MVAVAYVPRSKFLDDVGYVSIEWLLWLQNPRVSTLTLTGTLAATSGGTGTAATPGVGQILVGDGTSYIPAVTLPASAFPALSGDVSTAAGALATTLATVNANVGAWGTGTQVGTITVNAKGLVTAAALTSITGSPGAFTAVGAFGCNTKAAQTAAASGGAVATTGATNVVPFGYTTAAQADAIVTLLNNIRAALVANGIMS